MSERSERRLQAKIVARNRAGEVANELYPQFLAIFKPLAGQKVCKVNGEFIKNVAKQLPPSRYYNQEPSVMYYRNRSDYTVSFTVRTCASDGQGSCAYEEITVYICDLDNGVIRPDGRWYDPPNCRTDYTADEVKRLRADYEEKKRIADEAHSALYPFGEHDNF